jgi:hypothetical protein
MSDLDLEWKIATARTRGAVYLVDGRPATLVCWQRNAGRAKVCVDGRHTWVTKDEIVWPELNTLTTKEQQ